MTQFGQYIQLETKSDLPDFVRAFYYRVVDHLNQKDYHSIVHYKMNEIVARKESLGEDYHKYVVPFIFTVMAIIHFYTEKYKDAIKSLNSALVLQEKMLGKKHLMLGATLNNLAVVYAKKGQYKKVKMLAERALEIFDPPQSVNHHHSFVAEKLVGLARYFNNQGKYKEEKRCYIRSLQIYETTQKSDDTLVAAASNELAMCYLRRGKLRKAEEYFKNVLSKACRKEFGVVSDRSTRLNKVGPKKVFNFSKDGNQSVTSIWQIAEERERDKTKVIEEVSLPVWYWLATFYTPSFEFALKGLEAIYKKQGKYEAAKTLNYYANQQSVAPQLPPRRCDIIQASSIPTPPPLPSPPPSPIPPARENEPHRWSVNHRIEITVQHPPPPLPIKGIKPGSTDSRRNNPIMRPSPPQPLPSIPPLPPVRGMRSPYEAISQGIMVLPSEPQAEENESFIGTEVVQEHTRSLERIVAELQAEITEKAQRLAEAERALETHGAFCCICLDEVANRMWSGCNHLVACGECAERLLREEENRSDDGIACPKCRTHGHVLPAFI